MRSVTRSSGAVALVLTLTCLPACNDDDADDAAPGASGAAGTGGYHPSIDPSEFSSSVDNPFLPWQSGLVLSYVEDETDTIVVSVLDETRVVMGVECVVVHDVVSDEDGATVEDTYDWYAQDSAGAVWYFGEETVEYDADGTPNPAGSWEAGVDGALPGIAMPAEARLSEPYRQEFYPGEAEDMGQIIAVDVAVEVPAGSFTGCLVTKDWSALHPTRDIENKVYCPGIGNVKAEVVEGGEGLELLTEMVLP